MTDMQIDRYVKLEGTNHDPRRKLTVEDVRFMKKGYREGTSVAQLATEYGVCPATVMYHVIPGYKKKHNEYRKNFKVQSCDQVALFKSRVELKKKILAGAV